MRAAQYFGLVASNLLPVHFAASWARIGVLFRQREPVYFSIGENAL
jgi:hypothetical protein